ncbi:MAG: polyribonucleotide nucleotidyltransferase [Coriobacteriales bacterium]|nr:polyribonucleotide nucleotidyltransferase [Coriobacteriales bacterium]MDY5661585.1 polyribonucleotide nucleotidyltransferase [Coriobacteriales bacterium]
MSKVTHEFDLYGKHYSFETGELAKQATGAVVVKQGDTILLTTAVISKEKRDLDFFPLTVDFIEKMYAVGRIPGGYLKREARPSEKGTLTARLVDRPIRPGFPDGFRNDVQIVITTLSCDQVNQPDVPSIMGASAALMVGGAPFDGPVAGVRIGRNRETGEYIVNPTFQEDENSDLNLTVAGTKDYLQMVEAGADEVSEEDMVKALEFGQKVIGEFCDEQQKFLDKCEITPFEYELDQPIPEVIEKVESYYDQMASALKDADKQSRIAKVEALKDEIKASFTDEQRDAWGREIAAACKALERKAMRTMIIETGERVDGRKSDEIRPLFIKPHYLPRAHGSGLFQRGQTQVLSVCTLGMLNEWQRLDTIDPAEGKRYMHQYNFPPYCTGETGRMGAPKRRELGHGALASRALEPMIPSEEEFPYAIRVVSEVMESNGSSSMASTCGSTLALMDAGVPIKRPVSGVAMGLIQEEGKHVILTDIQGLEDFLGDMDFKVTGTTEGITALQMDNKAKGLTTDILAEALQQAKRGRAFILDAMLEQISEPREELSEFAPRIITIKIPVDKIRDVIGSGGKVIRGMQEETGATIEVHEDGNVFIASTDQGGEQAKKMIEDIVKVPEVGEEYEGEVVNIQSFGAFVKLTPNKDGLLHISRVANGRVGKVEDVLSEGDIVKVKIIDVDEKTGKISLDRLDKPDAPASSEAPKKERDNRPGRAGRRERSAQSHDNRRPRRRNHSNEE